MKKIIDNTYMKYGYRMYNCSVQELEDHKRQVYNTKKQTPPGETFGYRIFNDTAHAIRLINSVYVPADHGELPVVHWELKDANTLLVKTIGFCNYEDQTLYQNSVERGWALGGHLDPRVEQVFYD